MVDKIALVDIDGCLVRDGELNMALVERLKSEGYDQIALFTQRSKFMLYEKLSHGIPSNTTLYYTPDIVEALEKHGLSVKVSTSVDHYVGEPLQYYDELAKFERQYQQFLVGYDSTGNLTDAQASQLSDLYKQILIELQHVAQAITEQDIQALAERTAATEGGSSIAWKKEFTELLSTIATTSVQDLANDTDGLEGLIRQWQRFHPHTKVAQKQAFDATFPKVRIDYFDDSVANITEIHEANPDHAPTSFVVHGSFIMPIEIYQAKGFKDEKALGEALALNTDAFTVTDIMGYLANPEAGVRAFAQQLMVVAEIKAVNIFNEVKNLLVADSAFGNKFKKADGARFAKGLPEDFQAYCMTQKLDTLQAIRAGDVLVANKFLEGYDASRPEHFYQQYLLAKANEVIANTLTENLRFDTQARVLTEVTLTEKDYRAIYERIRAARGLDEQIAEPTYQQALEKLLCVVKPLSVTTLCNIDIRKDAALLEKFKAWLMTVDTPCAAPRSSFSMSSVADYHRVDSVSSDELESEKQGARNSALSACSQALLKGDNLAQMSSINALQEEMEMHISLALHVHRKAFEAQYPSDHGDAVPGMLWDRAREKAVTAMTQTIKTTFQDALIASHKDGVIDFVSLNDHLDKARKRLKGNCQDALVKACLFTIPDFKARCQEPVIAKGISRKAYSATTATSHDYFTSSSTGLSTRISGSDNTSHHKEAGRGHQAMRLRVHSDGSVMLRLPSIPEVDIKYTKRLSAFAQAVRVSFFNAALSVANGFIGAFNHFADEAKKLPLYEKVIGPWQAKLNDTADKIIEAETALRTKLGDYKGPIILNRETSIPYTVVDNHLPGANRQGLRIEVEIKAIHQVNAKRSDGCLVFMQGIPVNQHTQNLGYNTSGVLKEATLMADMAMLANLREQLPLVVNQQHYDGVIGHYQDFLKQDPFPTNTFFCDSKHGQKAIEALTALKKPLSSGATVAASQDLKVAVNQALLQVFSHDLHLKQQYGMLIQSLSTYGQATAIAGCKSANERFAEVEGRADLLRQLNLEPCPLPAVKAEMLTALQNFKNDPSKIDALVACMDKCFNEYTLQERSSAAVSLLDQGAASKVGAFEESRFGRAFQVDTNRAENEAVDRLKTKGTSALQAHSKKSDHAAEIKSKTKKADACRNFDACTPQIKALHQFLIDKLGAVENSVKPKLRDLIALLENPFTVMSDQQLLDKVIATGVLTKCNADELTAIGIERIQAADLHTVSTNRDSVATEDSFSLTNRGELDLAVDPEVSRANPVLLNKADTEQFIKQIGTTSGVDFDGFFDEKRRHDPTYVAHRSEALEMVLNQEQKQKLIKLLLPPATGLAQPVSSVSNDHTASANLGEKATMAAIKYGSLAVAIATFVLSKGAM